MYVGEEGGGGELGYGRYVCMDGWMDDEHEHHVMLSCENGCNGLWTCEGVDGGPEYVLV